MWADLRKEPGLSKDGLTILSRVKLCSTGVQAGAGGQQMLLTFDLLSHAPISGHGPSLPFQVREMYVNPNSTICSEQIT